MATWLWLVIITPLVGSSATPAQLMPPTVCGYWIEPARVGGARETPAPSGQAGPPTLAERADPDPLDSAEASDEELAVAFQLDTIADLPVIANLELLEWLLEVEEAG